ncbi:MAG: cyanophycinase [Peptococcaceae bacterium]|jgi:cyanophycinase|nr:cyanophycinase [Peptococcaceae bacterium]
MMQYNRGNLLIIGGAEDKEKECKILKFFYKEAGGKDSRICIITAASERAAEAAEPYQELFKKFGCADVTALNFYTREDANSPENLTKIKRSSGIFFTGGDQLRITAMLGGTEIGKALHMLYENNVIIAGTSAGASVMSDTMIIGGEGDTPGEDLIRMGPGLGLLRGVIIDQHFAQRGRIGRLLTAVALNPHVLGIGIDEDTSIHVRADGKVRVVGRGTALILDAANAVLSNVDELYDGRPLAFAPVRLHVLCEGFEFNIWERTSSRQ